MVGVTGPRIDPRSIPTAPGLDVRSHVHKLCRDLAVVQGGLTTAMELTSNQRPFLYFPLQHHFEQQVHVAHRLDRYGVGRRMDYETATVADIADAIVEEIARDIDYLPVETDGARRAAMRLTELL